MDGFDFQVTARERGARAGLLRTPHGTLETPIFAPVGTQGTVKALTPAQLEELGASLVLANTYHLMLRPGDEVVAELGGLHAFMQWPRPILTDSGGFQVFSLSTIREVDEDGISFRSHLDGSTHRLTPETAISVQENLGADIIMALDECPPPQDRRYNESALARTHAWAERCLRARRRTDQLLFGIIQGGIFLDLRENSARFLTSFGFPGYGIGGLSVGETKPQTYAVLDLLGALLPEERPRYLMGLGTTQDLIEGVARGIDIFDCVLPTRLARHRTALTRAGRLNLISAVYRRDPRPIESGCHCYTCQHFSRGYLRHLVQSREMLAATLLSIHNLYLLVELTREMREAIREGKFHQMASAWGRVGGAGSQSASIA